jgi:transposase-like protein
MDKKVYTKEFKVGAARMVVDEKMRPSHAARDLGVSNSAITKWIRDYKKHGSGHFRVRVFWRHGTKRCASYSAITDG